MLDSEIRQLADEDYYHAQKLLLTTATTVGEVVEGRDLFIVSTGVPLGAFNIGVAKPDGDEVGEAIAGIERYFGSRDLPYRIQLRDDQVKAFEPQFLEAGYAAVQPTPAMVLRKMPEIQTEVPGLTVEEISAGDVGGIAAFRSVVEEGFGMPQGMGVAAISDRVVAHADTALFLGREGGAPVSTALLSMTNRVAGIYMVSTAEAYRKRGFGAALTWACVHEGARRGARFASLQASLMGRPVYERMGFETLSTYHMYASPGSDPSGGFGG
ncbi:MAG: GNAT family N-acetyltransferase [Myxococcota bacterium]